KSVPDETKDHEITPIQTKEPVFFPDPSNGNKCKCVHSDEVLYPFASPFTRERPQVALLVRSPKFVFLSCWFVVKAPLVEKFQDGVANIIDVLQRRFSVNRQRENFFHRGFGVSVHPCPIPMRSTRFS